MNMQTEDQEAIIQLQHKMNVRSPHSGITDTIAAQATFQVEVSQVKESRPMISKFSAHLLTNENGLHRKTITF